MSGKTLNQRVLVWTRGKTGQKIGRGECWDMADAALRQAGARSSITTGEDDDYDWGTAIELKDIHQGDILQFRDYVVTTTTVTETIYPDGTSESDMHEESVERPHHTAVVDTVLGHGKFKILEQNIEPKGKHIQKHTLHTEDETKAPKTSHKRIKDDSGTMIQVKVTETVTVTITGQVWAYRPQAQ